jgi:hypothetical protein
MRSLRDVSLSLREKCKSRRPMVPGLLLWHHAEGVIAFHEVDACRVGGLAFRVYSVCSAIQTLNGGRVTSGLLIVLPAGALLAARVCNVLPPFT